MSGFEYVMVLVSIIIGLAITHVLTALSTAIHRLRGHGEPIRLEPVYLLWTGYVLNWLVSFWWWEFKFQEIEAAWSYGLFLFLVSYSIVLFLLATVLVPAGMERLSDSYAFFMEGRRWFFGTHLVMIGFDIADRFLKGAEWGLRPIVLLQYAVLIVVSVTGIISERRAIQLIGAATAFTIQLLYMFKELGVLGS